MNHATEHILPSNLDRLSQCRRIVLLQGPLGTFFRNLAKWLEHKGAHVFKINFNGGDALFYPESLPRTVQYTDRYEYFADFLQSLIQENHIDAVVCFGDTRPYHSLAKTVCHASNTDFWVFEEGYFRPYWVTLEQHGVNAFSTLPRQADFYAAAQAQLAQAHHCSPQAVPTGFLPIALIAMRYYWAMYRKQKQFPHYVHHRDSRIAYYLKAWARSAWRKMFYRFTQRNIAHQVKQGKFGRFFIVPLQVATDSQVHCHSDFADVRHFLLHVLTSFAHHAPSDTSLFIKHHPMDRGFTNYTADIKQFIAQHPHLRGRVHYVHDVPLPVFLRHGTGMITLNSTSGLSALLHKMPVKVLGRAHYDVMGLTSPQKLPEFWHNPAAPQETLFHAYRMYHLNITQINGSFYSHVHLP